VTRRSVAITLAVTVLSLLVLAGLVLTILLAVRGGSSGLGLGGRIAILNVDGVIADDAELLDQIREFRDDPSVKGYLVQINSPGGGVGPSQSIYAELRRVRDEDGQPVIASIGGVGASGGYYIALAADSIYALPGSITGSIGVIMELPDASGLMDKVGVRMNVVESAEHKDVGSPFRPITPGDRQILGELVSDVYQQFVEVVARERKLDTTVVKRVADGRIMSGRQAKQNGLVDRLGNFTDALAAAGRMAGLGDEPATVRPPEDRATLLDLLLGRGAVGAIGRMIGPLENVNSPRVKYVVPW
jgi:protease IV